LKGLALLSVALLLLCGCTHDKTSPPSGPPVSGPPRLFTEFDVKPTGAPPQKAVLSLDGVKVPVRVKVEKDSKNFTINLYTHDELFDFEKYVVQDGSFSLSEGALETYQPAIPLLVFPFAFAGPSREWQGTLSGDSGPHPAHASVDVAKDDIVWNGSSSQAIRVTVVIFLDDVHNSAVARRTMEFWFAPGHGLLKRDFDNASIREPVEE